MRNMMERFFNEPMDFSEFMDEGGLPVDISERDNALIVRASLPGVKKDDIDVQVNQGVLSITARRSEESETRNERYYRRERHMGAVSRRIALPGIVQDADVDAELKDGILTLTLPVPEQHRPKRIEIRSEGDGHMVEGSASQSGVQPTETPPSTGMPQTEGVPGAPENKREAQGMV